MACCNAAARIKNSHAFLMRSLCFGMLRLLLGGDMYALAVLRYRKDLEDVLLHVEAHRAYLKDLKTQGLLLASGPLVPRSGGALLLRLPTGPTGDVQQQLDAIRDNDPFVKAGVAQYELMPWEPVIGREALDLL